MVTSSVVVQTSERFLLSHIDIAADSRSEYAAYGESARVRFVLSSHFCLPGRVSK